VGILAASKERIDGRNSAYETISLQKRGWTTSDANTNAMALGQFWVNEPYFDSNFFREYFLTNQTFRVRI
jgi:hypothetical protein